MSPQINLTFAAPTVADFIAALNALQGIPGASVQVSAPATLPQAPRRASATLDASLLSPAVQAEALDRINAARASAGKPDVSFIRFTPAMGDIYGSRDAYVAGVADGSIAPYLGEGATSGNTAPALATVAPPVLSPGEADDLY